MSLIPAEQERPTAAGSNEDLAVGAAPPPDGESAAAVRAAQAAMATGDVAAAEALLRERLDAAPDDARALVAYGGLLMRSGRLVDARPVLERARAADSKWPEPVVFLCRLGQLQQNEQFATEMARDLLAKWPHDVRAVEAAVRPLRAAGSTGDAVAGLRRLSGLRLRLVSPLLKLAELLLASGDAAGAAEAAQEAVARAPRDPRSHMAVVDAVVACGDVVAIETAGLAAAEVEAKAAARAVTALVKLEDTARAARIATMLPPGTLPNSFVKAIVELQKQRLRAAEQRGDDDAVERVARSILRAQPNDGPSTAALKRLMIAARESAREAMAAGRISAAVELLGRAHGYAPERSALLEEAARALEQGERWEEAGRLWLRAVESGSGATAARRAARAASKADDVETILAAWTRVASLEPDSEDTAERLSRAVARLVKLARQAAVEGREDEALRRARAVLAAAPGEPRAIRVVREITAQRLRAMRAARRARDSEAAEVSARSLLEADGGNAEALRALARLMYLDGRHHEAYDLYLKLKAVAPDDQRIEAALKDLRSLINN